MTPGQQSFLMLVEKLGLQDQVLRSTVPVHTAEATAAAFGVPVSRIGRTVATVTHENQIVFIVGPATRRLDLRRIGALLHTRLRTIPKAELLSLTGYAPEGVSPVCHSSGGLVLIDASLWKENRESPLLVAAGSGEHVLNITLSNLIALSDGLVIDFDANPSQLRLDARYSADNFLVPVEFLEIQGVDQNTRPKELDAFVRQVVADVVTNREAPSNEYNRLLQSAGVLDQVPSTVFLDSYVRKNCDLPRINPIVDCYNASSLQLDVVASAHDTDRLEGPITVSRAEGGESFHAIGSKRPVLVRPGEWYIKDQTHLLCRNNCKQSDYSKVSEETKSILIYVQGHASLRSGNLRRHLNYVAQNVVDYCGGKRAPVSPATEVQ
jgi:DNA/RNA-binding domain of Phe-tRNA-synthetase-like protein/prolyl-tRNA editing enzyme YbaK/EbsC (Cys-tRNA(Pro) deacylase)